MEQRGEIITRPNAAAATDEKRQTHAGQPGSQRDEQIYCTYQPPHGFLRRRRL